MAYLTKFNNNVIGSNQTSSIPTQNMIKGAIVAQVGFAKGHFRDTEGNLISPDDAPANPEAFQVIADSATLEAWAQIANAQPVKPMISRDHIQDKAGIIMGDAANFRVEGDSLLCDITYAKAALNSKGETGDLARYTLDVVDEKKYDYLALSVEALCDYVRDEEQKVSVIRPAGAINRISYVEDAALADKLCLYKSRKTTMTVENEKKVIEAKDTKLDAKPNAKPDAISDAASVPQWAADILKGHAEMKGMMAAYHKEMMDAVAAGDAKDAATDGGDNNDIDAAAVSPNGGAPEGVIDENKGVGDKEGGSGTVDNVKPGEDTEKLSPDPAKEYTKACAIIEHASKGGAQYKEVRNQLEEAYKVVSLYNQVAPVGGGFKANKKELVGPTFATDIGDPEPKASKSDVAKAAEIIAEAGAKASKYSEHRKSGKLNWAYSIQRNSQSK